MFTEEVLKRFNNPKNAGELKDFNGKGTAGDPKCSDVIEMFIKVKKNKIINAKFKVFGCPGAISTTDVFIDLIKGNSIEFALNVTDKDISCVLGGLPTKHMHCTKLPKEAFEKAIQDYNKNKI